MTTETERTPDLVFQPMFNGYPAQIRRTVARALDETAINALADSRSEFDLEAEIAALRADYADLLGEDLVPSLAHMLALEYVGARRESVDIHVHDLSTPTGDDSMIGSYDLLSPQDPSYWLVETLVAVADEGLDHEEGEARLDFNLRRFLEDDHVERQVVQFRRFEELFGYPEGDPRNLFSEPYPKGGKGFAQQVVDRATGRLHVLLDRARQPSPTP